MKRPDSEIIEDIREVELALEPDTISCDGELPQSEVRKRYRKLTAKKAKLVKELGREATFDELFGHWMKKR